MDSSELHKLRFGLGAGGSRASQLVLEVGSEDVIN